MNLFAVGAQEFGWQEIRTAVQAWQEWLPWVTETREILVCLQHAQTVTPPVPAQEVNAAVTAFRYAHQLISAQETQSWLAVRGVSVADLTNYHFGQLLRLQWAAQLPALVAAHPVSAEELTTFTRKFAICSGRLFNWAQKLAGRAAVARAAGSCWAEEGTVAARLAAIEAAFAAQRANVLTPAALHAQISAHQLDWLRCDCQYIWYGVEHLAREAAFCLQEDGLSLEALAWDSRSIVQEWSFYLDELAPAPRARFLTAGRGDVLGPLAMLEGFPLFTIQQKHLPQAADPAIRRRAEQAVLQSLVAQEMNQHVTWLNR